MVTIPTKEYWGCGGRTRKVESDAKETFRLFIGRNCSIDLFVIQWTVFEHCLEGMVLHAAFRQGRALDSLQEKLFIFSCRSCLD